MKLIIKQKAGASATDSLANLSVIGIFQTVEEAVTELLGELKADNITMKKTDNVIISTERCRLISAHYYVWHGTMAFPLYGLASR